MLVLLVCTGNTCRSSMAEYLLRHMIKDTSLETQIEVASAGLAAFPNQPASPHAIDVTKNYGCDLSVHRSRQLTKALLAKADLVLTMTKQHSQYICERFPQFHRKVYPLKAYVAYPSESQDIIDPFGQSLEHYQETAGELVQVLELLLDKLRQLIPQNDLNTI